MKRVIKVADLIHGRCALEMSQVLADLSPEAHALQWRILDLGEVSAEERWDLNMPLIAAAVAASPEGMPMTFEDLMAFADRVDQVIDGLFVGCARLELPRRDQSDEEIVARAGMLVAAIDSSFWLVSAPDELLARYEQRFEHVETIDVGTVRLSTWGREP